MQNETKQRTSEISDNLSKAIVDLVAEKSFARFERIYHRPPNLIERNLLIAGAAEAVALMFNAIADATTDDGQITVKILEAIGAIAAKQP